MLLTPIVALAAATLLIPLAAMIWMVRSPAHPAEMVLRALAAGSLVLWSFFGGLWGVLEFNMRFLLLIVFALALLQLYLKAREAARAESPGRRWPARLLLAVGVALNLLVFAGRVPFAEPVDLGFPLTGGTFYVLQGGSSPLTNPLHWNRPAARYALDLVKFGELGGRAAGIAPYSLKEYASWDELVYSPCDGTVAEVEAGLGDNPAGHPDAAAPAGNQITLTCGRATVLLAHLQKGTLYVAAGDRVKTGQPLGTIGNSGDAVEPHLHIQATIGAAATGQALPMRFAGRFLTLNSLFIIDDPNANPPPAPRP